MENPFLSFAEKLLVGLDEFVKNRGYRRKKFLGGVFVFLVVFFYIFLISAPDSFPKNDIVNIRSGSGLYSLSIELEQNHVIRSAVTFRTLAILLGGEKDMKAGDYYLPLPENSITLAWRILHGYHEVETVKITIPEGFDTKEISSLFDKRFLKFNHEEFLSVAPEGYLFPDTYFVEVGATASSTIELLRNNFNKKVANLMSDINKSGHSLDEIIIMASILEAEAKSPEEMSMASGILWKRIKIDMPLQVDSAMETYKEIGLPKGPINNPGLNAIKASLYPKTSSYLYFLTDKTGVMHYAKTFDEHKANKAKYLR